MTSTRMTVQWLSARWNGFPPIFREVLWSVVLVGEDAVVDVGVREQLYPGWRDVQGGDICLSNLGRDR